MSEVWSEQERARRLARLTGTPDRVERMAKRGGAIGCLLMIALLVLGLAAVVTLLWRRALGG